LAAHARLLLLVLAVASPAGAELLAFEGRLVAVLPGLGEAEIASGPGVARVDGIQIRELEILDAAVAGSTGIPVTDPTAAPVTSVRLSASLAPGTLGIDPFGGPVGQPAITSHDLPMPGELRVCMLVAPLPPCVGGFAMPLTRSDGGIGVGVGGLVTFGGSATVRVSLYGAPFTLNTVSATGATENGAVFTLFSAGSIKGPGSFTSSAGQTGGYLSLVTPSRVLVHQPALAANLVPGFLRLEIEFVPESGVGVLLASGAAGLFVLARRRPRSRGVRPPKT
jgi:hypothetical protein